MGNVCFCAFSWMSVISYAHFSSFRTLERLYFKLVNVRSYQRYTETRYNINLLFQFTNIYLCIKVYTYVYTYIGQNFWKRWQLVNTMCVRRNIAQTRTTETISILASFKGVNTCIGDQIAACMFPLSMLTTIAVSTELLVSFDVNPPMYLDTLRMLYRTISSRKAPYRK